MKWARRTAKNEKGSVAVEFALFLPLFLLVIFSIIELGGAWYQKQMLVSASREGARYASLYSDPPASAADVQSYVSNFLTQSGFPGTPTINVTGSDGSPGDQVTVQISSAYNFPVLNNLVAGVMGSINLSATTVMRHE